MNFVCRCTKELYVQLIFLIFIYCCCLVAKLCPTVCNPMDCSPTRLLCPWDFSDRNTGVSCHILPGIELYSLLHWKADSSSLTHQGSPIYLLTYLIFIWLCSVLVVACRSCCGEQTRCGTWTQPLQQVGFTSSAHSTQHTGS